MTHWTPAATSQLWTAGWDLFSEPLDFANSKVTWQVTSGRLVITYVLIGATPSKLYQVGVHLFCDQGDVPGKQFGRFPTSGPCATITRQGVTASIKQAEFAVVLTDAKGSGTVRVSVGAPLSGSYAVEFDARNGAGCGVAGGGGNNANTCDVDFQSPGPFGTTTTIVIP